MALMAARVTSVHKGGGKLLGRANTIGILEIDGIIFDSREILEHMDELVEDDGVKALVVRINSPGGVIAPTQEVYRELRRLREDGMVVVASFGDVAASGGYYIGAAADKIVANPGTLTGSIGVIIEFMNFRGALEKLMIKAETIKSGPFKDTGNPARDMRDDEREVMGEIVTNLYEQFLRAIAEGRGMDIEAIRPHADGRVFSGEMAMGYGLVDRMGTLRDAVDWTAELAGIQGEPELVYPRPRPMSFLEMLAESGAQSIARVLADTRARGALPSFYFMMDSGWGAAP